MKKIKLTIDGIVRYNGRKDSYGMTLSFQKEQKRYQFAGIIMKSRIILEAGIARQFKRLTEIII